MSKEQTIINEFKQSTQNCWATNGDYDEVNALLLHWDDDDLNVEPEVQKLRQLLQVDLNFNPRIYAIPSENAGTQLQRDLAAFIDQNSVSTRSLTIVYYAGHADNADDKGPTGYSEWRAKEEGGPTLDWFKVQSCLYMARGDVLVILDCCFAAIRPRGDSKEGKMEVLAACGSDSRVPQPGRFSFTSVLIREIRNRLRVGEVIGIKALHKHLWADGTHLALKVNPVYFDLSQQDQRSIILRPLLVRPPSGFVRKIMPPSSFMLLRVSLEKDITGFQIANWLKSFPPAVIQDVDIEALVLQARRLEGLKTKEQIFPGTILGKLSPPAQREILQSIQGLSRVMLETAAFANHTDSSTKNAYPEPDFELPFGTRVINEIQDTTSGVCDTIEDSLLLDPNITLQEAAEDEVASAVDAKDAITLRQYFRNTIQIPDALEIPSEAVAFSSSEDSSFKQRFRYGTIAARPVIIETPPLMAAPNGSAHAPRNTTVHFKHMVAQLSQSKRTSFHILPCVGYIEEPRSRQHGVVFAMHEGLSTAHLPTTLGDLYAIKKRVALGIRINLAYVLAVAVGNFHRVGWVHKELKSDNILFFHRSLPLERRSPRGATDLDLSQPFLFGFESSRPEDGETVQKTDYTPKNNAYRHPERWGKPLRKFQKFHDAYALGVVCLEIALWQQATNFRELNMHPPGPRDIKSRLEARAKEDIPHLVGQDFADAIDACLRFQEITRGMNDFSVHQQYKTKIIAKLAKAAKHT